MHPMLIKALADERIRDRRGEAAKFACCAHLEESLEVAARHVTAILGSVEAGSGGVIEA